MEGQTRITRINMGPMPWSNRAQSNHWRCPPLRGRAVPWRPGITALEGVSLVRNRIAILFLYFWLQVYVRPAGRHTLSEGCCSAFINRRFFQFPYRPFKNFKGKSENWINPQRILPTVFRRLWQSCCYGGHKEIGRRELYVQYTWL